MSFLRANTVSKEIKEIGKQIEEIIAQDINIAKCLSVLMDKSMDVN